MIRGRNPVTQRARHSCYSAVFWVAGLRLARQRRLWDSLWCISATNWVRIAEIVATDWSPSEPPEPADVIRRVVKAGFRLTTFASLRRYLDDTRRKGEVPFPNTIVPSLLPWARNDRYYPLLRWDLPAS